MGSPVQGGQMRPQQPQQRPMGPQQNPQGKGPGLPMPNDRMGGQRPYQPVGANNGPFHQNPVAPVQQPIQQMPPQGKGGAVAQPAPQQPMQGQMPPVNPLQAALYASQHPGMQGQIPAAQPGQMPQGKGPGLSVPMNQPGMGPMGPTGPGTFQ